MLEDWDCDVGIALLLVEHVELIEKVELCPRRRLEGVQTLQSRLEAEQLEQGLEHKSELWI